VCRRWPAVGGSLPALRVTLPRRKAPVGCDKEVFAALWESSGHNRLGMSCDVTPSPRHLFSPEALRAEMLCDIARAPVERLALLALHPPVCCDKEGWQRRDAGLLCDILCQGGDKEGDLKDHGRFQRRDPSTVCAMVAGYVGFLL